MPQFVPTVTVLGDQRARAVTVTEPVLQCGARHQRYTLDGTPSGELERGVGGPVVADELHTRRSWGTAKEVPSPLY
jgi:hypothetical protein